MWRSIPLKVRTVAMIPKELSQARVSLEVDRKARKRAEPPVKSPCGHGKVKQKGLSMLVLNYSQGTLEKQMPANQLTV